MKNLKNQLFKVFAVVFIASLAVSCPTQQKDEHQEHDNMMHDDQTEIMDGEDHMHKDEQAEEHMMDDSTSIQRNEEMQQIRTH